LAEATINSTTGTTPSTGENDFVALAPGKMVGRYEIVSILGQGGFGITYRAHDQQLHREVAIKEYLPSALAIRQDGTTVLPRSTKVAEDFGWGRQRFVDEGRTLATLQRAPAIVRVYDFLEANGTAYIVMELVPGHTLEDRLKKGPITPPELDKILWPLLDGLEQVHATGFLHRDIKPANILLDDNGNPTLIDFGASRAAMAGRSQAMTAIFTPGYAAAEQMTSAKQGPWTDIYGLSATIYHAITGATPPSAFDRMLDDDYKSLGQLQPAGFLPGLLVGIDAGLAVRASDRPQSIAGWRPILGQATMAGAQATMAMSGAMSGAMTGAMTRAADPNATIVVRQPTIAPTISPTITPVTAAQAAPVTAPAEAASPRESRRTRRRWVAAAVVLIFALAGGYRYATRSPAVDVATLAKAEADAKAQVAAAAKAKQNEEELTRFRAEQTRREQEAHDAELKRQAAAEERQRLAAEEAEKKKKEDAAKALAAEQEAARQKALESDKAHAAEVENALHLSLPDRQHVQVALTALGFGTNGTDGVFGQHTHDMVASWQKSRSYPDTGYLTGAQNQELLRTAAAAVSKFDDDQKKAEDEKKKAAAAAPPPVAAVAPASSPSQVQPSAARPASGSPDGLWSGTYQCTPSNNGGPFTMPVRLQVQGGHGTYVVPGSSDISPGNHSLAVTINGATVSVARTYLSTAGKKVGSLNVGSLMARFEGGTITGSGPEANSGGRNCTVILTH
jgi:peptidoglycan hydrolase-like protein with peptidoglycan-binding domain